MGPDSELDQISPHSAPMYYLQDYSHLRLELPMWPSLTRHFLSPRTYVSSTVYGTPHWVTFLRSYQPSPPPT